MARAEHAELWRELDNLPCPTRPALTFTTVIIAADEGARSALAEVARGRGPHARGALERHLEGLLPPRDLNTPDAWARRGAVAGAIAAWGVVTDCLPVYQPPVPCPSMTHAAVHLCAWNLAAAVVTGVRYE